MKIQIYGKRLTIILSVLLVLVVVVMWSLFISGPNRVYEVDQAQRIAKIEKSHKGIEGITRHQFDYVTYQGYTETTLFWFDANGDEITQRDINTLDYEGAKKKAQEEYKIEAESIELGYGYDNPVYEIRTKKKILLLDYDTLERVYEREV